jgi:hypothetical protein
VDVQGFYYVSELEELILALHPSLRKEYVYSRPHLVMGVLTHVYIRFPSIVSSHYWEFKKYFINHAHKALEVDGIILRRWFRRLLYCYYQVLFTVAIQE